VEANLGVLLRTEEGGLQPPAQRVGTAKLETSAQNEEQKGENCEDHKYGNQQIHHFTSSSSTGVSLVKLGTRATTLSTVT
jgi:hypothetical protein